MEFEIKNNVLLSYTEEKVTIHAAAGSYAESFAKENNIKFVAEKE